MNRFKMISASCVLTVALLTRFAMADTLNVPAEFATIQAAIDAAEDGDEVVVAPGTYPEMIDLLGKTITVRSSGGPKVTTIDGGGGGTVVTMESGEGPETLFEGFTITGGTINDGSDGGGGMRMIECDPIVENCHFINNGTDNGGEEAGNGGAVYIVLGAPQLTNCLFDNNRAHVGGAACYQGTFDERSQDPAVSVSGCTFVDNLSVTGGAIGGIAGPVHVIECTFQGNAVDQAFGGGAAGVGGAVAIGGLHHPLESVIVEDCEFQKNSANGFVGGALWLGLIEGPVLLRNCTFTGNTNTGYGGALGLEAPLPQTNVVACRFEENSSGSHGGAGWVSTRVGFINCVFAGNHADESGGALYNAVMDASFEPRYYRNCTFVSNTSSSGANIYLSYKTVAVNLVNTILLGNDDVTGAESIEGPGTTTATYSLVEGGWPGIGNIDGVPAFVDAANGDYRLTAGSTGIDAGHNWAIGPDTFDLDDDGNTSELVPTDLAGEPRVNADPADFDPGCGVPAVIDMGAHEFQFQPFEINFGDLTGDCHVGVEDLVALLTAWGDVELNCLADLNVDGQVNTTHLLTLLAAWGDCS